MQQGTKKGSNDERLQWRLIPAPASKIEIKSLATPTGLTTEGQSASVLLRWNNNPMLQDTLCYVPKHPVELTRLLRVM